MATKDVLYGISFTLLGFSIGVALNDLAKDGKDWAIDSFYGCGSKRKAVAASRDAEDLRSIERNLRYIIEYCARSTSATAATELAELYCWGFVESENPVREFQSLLRRAKDGSGVPFYDVLWTMEICKARGWLNP